jgi:peptidoglycan-associated lipoprotein
MTRNRKRATRPDAQATARLPWVAATLAAALLLGGCPSQPVKAPPESQPSTQPPAGDVGTAAVADRGLPPELNDPSSPLYQRVIYFDYDSSDIQPQFVEVLRAHALFLSTNPNRTITLEGHTDERGTREYNLALADQRAETVRRFLLAEGVARGQVNTLSYGEERPAQPGHDEDSWALNRRVELIY